MAQIKITHTSNADMNIGVPKQITMEQQTYGEWMRSNPKAPTDKYKTKPTENVTNNHTLTAVEWLVEELKSKGHALITTKGIFINVPNELLEQAKVIEKEQIEKAIDDALNAYGIIK